MYSTPLQEAALTTEWMTLFAGSSGEVKGTGVIGGEFEGVKVNKVVGLGVRSFAPCKACGAGRGDTVVKGGVGGVEG